MKVAFYSSKKYDQDSFNSLPKSSSSSEDIFYDYLSPSLDSRTVALSKGHDAVCIFVNDVCDAEIIASLKENGVKVIALRCAGFNNVDLVAAKEAGIKVVRVPAYSPESVAEFAVGHILLSVRKYHKAYNRVREGNFTLSGLVGFNLASKTIGIIGTGKIGLLTGKILSKGFGAKVIAYDLYPNEKVAAEHGISYVPMLDDLLSQADIISLHCPLAKGTYHLLDEASLAKTKKGVIIINTSRGGLIDTQALIGALKTGHVGAVSLDVYEGEDAYFFSDQSDQVIQDDALSRLLSFYNVAVTGHQAFLTEEALGSIASVTEGNLRKVLLEGGVSGNECEP